MYVGCLRDFWLHIVGFGLMDLNICFVLDKGGFGGLVFSDFGTCMLATLSAGGVWVCGCGFSGFCLFYALVARLLV